VADVALAAASRYVDETRVRTWQSWVNETIEWSRREREPAIVVYKEQHLLELYVNGRLAESYQADLGSNVLERKLSAGDQATPEGRYRIVRRLDDGESRYYKALLLDYPNEADRARLEEQRENGAVSASARPGGLIEIHGEGGRGTNWTDGCVALANDDMDELFSRVPVDTPVTIVGGNGRGGIFSDLVRELGQTETAYSPE
jgi:murein L,D-transpeptidase YafK